MRSSMKRGIGGCAALAAVGALLFVPQAASAATADETTDIQVIGINDFHGRIEANPGNGVAGAASLVGAVRQFESENPNTLFVSAGDNIGASTFTSFIQQDEPTMESLALGGLDVGVVGNHEFDQGYADLTDRVQPFYQQFSAEEGYGHDLTLGANVYMAGTQDPALREYAIREVDGVRVGFIGTITADTRTLVSPAGISEIEFGDQVEAANRVATEIADQVDVTVLLTHSGAEVSGDDAATCDEIANEQTEFGALVRDASPEIDAILSGHTHQAYPCTIQDRPILQTGSYGSNVSLLDLQIDTATKELVSVNASLVPLISETEELVFPAAEDIQAVVDAAVEVAAVEGNVPVGEISADILRGGEVPGDDRGVESPMNNLVADVYLWSTTEYAKYGGEPADIALMNAGGLRDDLLYASSQVGEGDGIVTYAEAAAVQPFANTITTSELTGADIEQILEEQWQPGEDRPKLQLGISDGFTYEYIDEAEAGEHVQSMTLNGEAIDPATTYTVTTNSFVSSGGDGFTGFTNGPSRDSGLIDLAATVDYFAEHDVVDPAPLGRAVVYEEAAPTPEPTPEPTEEPTPAPSEEPTAAPSEEPTAAPSEEPTEEPTAAPSEQPSASPSEAPLAPTGGDVTWGLGFGAAALMAAGIVLAARMRSRKA